MKADYLTYQRARQAAVVGLVVQTLVAGGWLIYAILADDHAARTSAVFFGAGVLGWLCLVILFDQHRRERIEFMEAEALAASGGESSTVFTQEELKPQARRLAMLHRALSPAVSWIIASVLIGFGVWRFVQYRELMNPAPAKEGGTAALPVFMGTKYEYALLAMGAVVAVCGFLVARFTAGMAKQPAWANLRAGAALAAGTSLLGLVHAVAIIVDLVGPNWLMEKLPWVVPIFLVVIGTEIVFNLILGAYRPRRANEIPKPAFDSRLLGFVAAPDRVAQSIGEAINYQLGFDVTGGWFYQLVSKTLAPLILVALVLMWLMTSVVIVQPHQRAMKLRFGAPVGEELAPGPHLKMPWPIESIYVPEYFTRDEKGRFQLEDRSVKGLRIIELGTLTKSGAKAILWTNDHPGTEVFQYVRSMRGDRVSDTTVTPVAAAAGVTPVDSGIVDLAMVSVEMPLHYTIRDVLAYDTLAAPVQRDELLKTVAQGVITKYFQTVYLDQILGADRPRISEELRELVQTAFDQLNPAPDGTIRGAGVDVVYVGVAGVHPPKAAAKAFETPVQADQRRFANMLKAEADKVQTLTRVVGDYNLAGRIAEEIDNLNSMLERKRREGEKSTITDAAIAEQELKIGQMIGQAGGRSASTLAQASAERWQKHMSARGRALRYGGQVAMYDAAPMVFLSRQYFDAMRKLTDGSRMYYVSRGGGELRMLVDGTDKDLGTDVFRPKEE
ncbi:MAG TPA: SPFH domain-containing protein [Phycisphaerales bacterium]|nr:SPFH domain-containing protein [Phycisphaerales bacterium]